MVAERRGTVPHTVAFRARDLKVTWQPSELPHDLLGRTWARAAAAEHLA